MPRAPNDASAGARPEKAAFAEIEPAHRQHAELVIDHGDVFAHGDQRRHAEPLGDVVHLERRQVIEARLNRRTDRALWIVLTGRPSHAVVLHGMSGDGSPDGTTVTVTDSVGGVQTKTWSELMQDFGAQSGGMDAEAQIMAFR